MDFVEKREIQTKYTSLRNDYKDTSNKQSETESKLSLVDWHSPYLCISKYTNNSFIMQDTLGDLYEPVEQITNHGFKKPNKEQVYFEKDSPRLITQKQQHNGGSSEQNHMTNPSQAVQDTIKDQIGSHSHLNSVEDPPLREDHIAIESIEVEVINKWPMKKKILIGLGILVFLVLPIVLGVYFSIPNKPEKIMMVHRSFPNYLVYQLNSSVINVMRAEGSDDQITRVNHTLIIAVKKNRIIQVDFLASLQKRSSVLLLPDGTIKEMKLFDQSHTFLEILKSGAQNSTEPDSQVVDIDDYQLDESQYNTTDLPEDSGIKFTPPVLDVFRFTLRNDGKLLSLTFPVKVDKQIVGFMKGLIKLFSPLLKVELYEANGTTKVQKRNGIPVSSSENSTDESSPDDLNYSEDNKYNHSEGENGQTILRNEAEISSNGPSQNTKESSSQQNSFNDQGQLQNSKASSDTQFMSNHQQPDGNSSTMNFNMNITSLQTATLNLASSFYSLKEYIQQYDGLIQKYEENNQTLTMTSEEIVKYIMNSTNSDDLRGQSRLLLESDGSLTIIKFGKEIKILSTNFLGCQIRVSGVAKFHLSIRQDPQNQYLKYLKLDILVGNILEIGFLKLQSILLDYEKFFSPLTLKFTLEQIENVFDLFKGDFISNIEDLEKIIASGDLEEILIPSILDTSSMLMNIKQTVERQMDLNSPVDTLRQIYSIVTNIENIIQTKWKDLLDPRSEFVQNVSSGLIEFSNASYADALETFYNVKNDLLNISQQGSTYLQNAIATFPESAIFRIGEAIKGLISQEIYNQYKQEMEKARGIVEFIRYVRDNGIEYRNQLLTILTDHKINILESSREIIDLYFSHQTPIVASSKSDVLNNFSIIQSEFTNLSKSFSDNREDTSYKSQQLFESVLHERFLSSYFSQGFTDTINKITPILQGIVMERGDCCQHDKTWYGKKYCARWNDARHQQTLMPQRFGTLNQQVASSFMTFAQGTELLAQNIKGITNSTRTIVQKFEEIQFLEDQITKDEDNPIDGIIQKLTDARDIAVWVRSLVGCGGTGHLDAYITHVGTMLAIAADLKSLFISFRENYTNILSQFNRDVFTQINEKSVIIQSSKIFFEDYEHQKNISMNYIAQLVDIVINYKVEQFVRTPSIIENVTSLYDSIRENYINLCTNQPQSNGTRESIKNQYKTVFEETQALNDPFFQGQIDNLHAILQRAGESLFDAYGQIPFCEMHRFFNQSILPLEPDLDNLRTLVTLYNNFTRIKESAENEMKARFLWINQLENEFYKLFSPEQYRSFINSTQEITSFLQTLVFNTSQHLSTLKEESKSIYILKIVEGDLLVDALDIFLTSSFDLDYTGMFSNYARMREVAELIIDKLSFEIIAVVVEGKEILDHYIRYTDNYQVGLRQQKASFQLVTQGFLNLMTSTTQDTLNKLSSDFQTMTNSLNFTLFGDFFPQVDTISSKYKDLVFKNEHLRTIHTTSSQTLNSLSQIMNEAKETIYQKMSEFSIKSLIDKIEIGSLNSVYQLGAFIENQFSSSIDIAKESIKKILRFQSLVQKNFQNLFHFNDILKEIETEIENQYLASVKRIREQIGKTQTYLDKNSAFYSKFKETDIYSQLGALPDEIEVEFREVWGETKASLDQISELLKAISQGAVDIMNQLNEVKLELQSVTASIKSRVLSIKDNFKTIQGKLFNLKSLIFITVKGDLEDIVKNSINNMVAQANKIVDVDLDVISKLTKKVAGERLAFIGEKLDNAKAAYGHLKHRRQSFVKNMNSGLNQIGRLLKTEIMVKMEKLKQGMIFIKAFTNLENPTQQMRVFQKSLFDQRIPLAIAKVYVFTVFGVFSIEFSFNFVVDISVVVDLLQVRTIDFGAEFSFSFQLLAQFSYGLPNIIQFGLYIRGNILRAVLYPRFHCVNVIPIQLLPSIANIPEISNSNIAKLNFATDLALYVAEIQVGYFIKHIWFELIWLRIKFCIKLIFFRLCINFRIPIGFKFIVRRQDYGYIIQSIPVLKKNILMLELGTFQL